MQAIVSVTNKVLRRVLTVSCWVLLASGCAQSESSVVREVPIQQTWELEPGQQIGDHRIAGGLGDISIEMRGDRIYAPFDGELQPNDVPDCYVFSSPEVPAYIFRLCGLDRPQLGAVAQGSALGSADFLGFATLRRQPDGHWTMVEPASDVLQRILDPNAVQVGGGDG